ncbi:hypothetical protein, partial [Burkholderia aenigmatica]|uniref:hypothetical protein n=1 Tax=Burkholderia aenigmatica TaxID=2015348 RepID=UPI001C2E4A8F
RAFNHVGQNSMKIFSSSGSVLCGHQQHRLTRVLVCAVIARPQSADSPLATDGASDLPTDLLARQEKMGKPPRPAPVIAMLRMLRDSLPSLTALLGCHRPREAGE